MKERVFLGVILVALVAAACRGSGEVSSDSPVLLNVDDVRQALSDEGFELGRTRQGANVDPVEHALKSLFKAFTTNEVQVIVFTYLSVEAREAVSEAVTVEDRELRFANPPESLELPGRGRVLAERNLIILLVSDDDGAVQRIEAALQSLETSRPVGLGLDSRGG